MSGASRPADPVRFGQGRTRAPLGLTQVSYKRFVQLIDCSEAAPSAQRVLNPNGVFDATGSLVLVFLSRVHVDRMRQADAQARDGGDERPGHIVFSAVPLQIYNNYTRYIFDFDRQGRLNPSYTPAFAQTFSSHEDVVAVVVDFVGLVFGKRGPGTSFLLINAPNRMEHVQAVKEQLTQFRKLMGVGQNCLFTLFAEYGYDLMAVRKKFVQILVQVRNPRDPLLRSYGTGLNLRPVPGSVSPSMSQFGFSFPDGEAQKKALTMGGTGGSNSSSSSSSSSRDRGIGNASAVPLIAINSSTVKTGMEQKDVKMEPASA
uniref:Uncharacterized protein n=1 Tax=Chromera velia CCMP2878 TaxID=1169474 RepID=A0A0G4IG06_9ALVE|eukprot:Cvel_14076.t1-p1 / transcript=Cvel_14076.t1 / gene=Cvel_14076 / organism=Chromera_velia_CCMP2878 / gene_product=hypothetical protein / transcript_product=hypothetical protein / location=Cvel_scaffold988:35798-36742(+) / protein_length=315 / sequence_SO=supercontig / SO=protein_coding / is_pseudo=false